VDQVLMNIVVNARDAMPEGGRLTVTTARAAVDGALADQLGTAHAALVTIADTGCGMDAATLEHIFEPFFTTKGPAKGSGLGLATASGIVAEAGGMLTASSEPGAGTTFTINLPLLPAAAHATVEPAVAPARAIGGREVVLVVEDEPALCELERLILEDAGYRVFAAANAAEALAVAAEHPIDAVIVDVVMPGTSGPELAQELAARGVDVPVVFVTGYAADEISSRGLAPSAVVEKPFQSDVLLRRIREMLDTHRTSPDMERVRCLACDTLYGRSERHELDAEAGCPRCGYVGWASIF
jgi:CheY-like chemotaxis protein